MSTKHSPRGSSSSTSGSASYFANLKVKTKIFGGFVTVLILLAAVSGSSYLSFRGVDKDFHEYIETAEMAVKAAKIERIMADMRRFTREYYLDSNPASAKSAQDATHRLSTALDESLAAADTPAAREKLNHIKDLVATYAKDVDLVVTLKTEEAKLVHDALDPLGSSLRERFEKLQADAAKAGNSNAAILANVALVDLMRLRLNANLFLDRHDAEALASANGLVAEFRKVLSGLDGATKGTLVRSSYDETATDSAKFLTALERAVVLLQEIDKLLNREHGELPKLAAAVQKDVDALLENAHSEEARIERETSSLIATTSVLVLIMAAGGFVVGIALAWLIGRAVATPVIAMTGAMRALANGEMQMEIPAIGRQDEVGQMASAVQVFKENMIKAAEMEGEKEKQRKADLARQQKVDQLIKGFESATTEVLATVTSAALELRTTAESMSSTAEETTRQATAVAAATEEASTNVQTVASAAEELSASITEIGRQIDNSTQIAGKAVANADATNAKVQALADASTKVGEVVKLINDIAGQTNLLALNATIEAARAGDAGKGFAVVAAEVKGLATQTAKATEEIAAQINAIQAATSDSVEAIGSIGKTIGEINQITTTIAAAVEEQTATTQEIARNVQQAAAGTSEVSSNISGVTQAAGETGSAASQVLAAASGLSEQAERLKGEVDKFLTDVRAA